MHEKFGRARSKIDEVIEKYPFFCDFFCFLVIFKGQLVREGLILAKSDY